MLLERLCPAVAVILCVASVAAADPPPGVAFDVRAEFERYDPNYRAELEAARRPLADLAARSLRSKPAGILRPNVRRSA